MDELQKEINKNVEKLLADHEKRLEVANSEMGEVKTHLQGLTSDNNWIKPLLAKLDTRIWWILGSVVVTGIAQIVITLIKN